MIYEVDAEVHFFFWLIIVVQVLWDFRTSKPMVLLSFSLLHT